MITMEDAGKRYGSALALAGLSFTARAGALTTLLGANGSGKTTALRVLAGLVKPDRGRAVVAGHDAWSARLASRRRLGFVPDAIGLYPRLRAREHLELSARLHGLSAAEARRATDRTVDALGLGPVAGRLAAGFSQGERMKVALGCALVHDPACLVLDEPTRGLDVPAVRHLRALLGALRARGVCIVMSSHVLNEVEALADEVVVVARGRTVRQGAPGELVRTTGSAGLEDAFVTLTQENGR
jgi:sodium transport system ATP-binding protein